jgi:hypothetical protein
MSLAELKKFGHYVSNGQQYYTLSDAKSASSKQVEYVLNDDIYTRHNWNNDPCPELSLGDLYRLRAEKLRQEHDYVVLMYSGGPDSTNILDTFCDNGLRIDEIVNFNSYNSTALVDGTLNNADFIYNVRPRLEQLRSEGKLDAKITIYDEVDMSLQHWHRMKKMGWDDIATCLGGPNMWLNIPYAHQYGSALWKRIQSKEKVCIIYGHDKPSSVIIDGKRAIYHSSLPLGNFGEVVKQYPALMAPLVKACHWFYVSPDSASIVMKQSYILNQFCNLNQEPEFYSAAPASPGLRTAYSWPSKKGYGNLKYDIFHRLIYPKWRPKFITPKVRDLLLRPQDCWWVTTLQTEQKSIWEHYVKNFVKENFANIEKSGTMMMVPPKTKPIFIE